MTEVTHSKDKDVARFVPEMLVELISRNARRGKEGLEPSSFFFQGVCLLVDISGFTKLSGDFCNLGKAGIDKLQLATNSYMEQLIEVIYSCGGEIVKFAGDAIICTFSTDFVTKISAKGSEGNFQRSMNECNFGSLLLNESLQNLPLRLALLGSTPFTPAVFSNSSNVSVQMSTMGSPISAEIILRAMHCANILRNIKTDKLSVHVAMSCGEMCFGILGGADNRWECLISGPCIHELSDILDGAESKQAVMSKECAEILHPSSTVGSLVSADLDGACRHQSHISSANTKRGTYQYDILMLPSGNYLIQSVELASASISQQDSGKNSEDSVGADVARNIPQSALDVARSATTHKLILQFVPVPLLDEMASGRDVCRIAEIREVTTMFMKWDSYDPLGLHRDLITLQRSFYAAQEILYSSGAYLRQFLVDDKGCVLIACWGVPHMTYLDNAQRALSSAALIVAALKRFNKICSFGITTGDVYCGTIGSAVRMEYAAIGSVVNIAARLMSKASGGILIDDATYQRLPQDLKGTVHSLHPIKVKGRDEPLVVYAYSTTTSTAVLLRENVADDSEIPILCREALMRVVIRVAHSVESADALYEQGNAKEQQHVEDNKKEIPKSSWPLLLSSFSCGGRERSLSLAYDQPLPILLIQGKNGSGRSTIIKWLSKQAHERRIPMFTVPVTRKDAQTDYFIWKRLFQLITPKDIFLNNNTQRTYIKALLGEIYPHDPQMGMTVGYPVMKAVLGITCTYCVSGVGKQRRKNSSNWLSFSARGVEAEQENNALQAMQIEDVLLRVFSQLLTQQRSLIIIKNVDLCGDTCLKVLLNLSTALSVTNSHLILTATDNTRANKDPERLTPPRRRVFRTASYEFKDSYATATNTPWLSRYRAQLVSLRVMELVILTDFTVKDINRMLSVALNVSVVPKEVSQLVQDFSGGSYFWVREILQFITEHGVEQFMSSVGESVQTTSRANTPTWHQSADSRSPQRSSLVFHSPAKTSAPATVRKGTSFRQVVDDHVVHTSSRQRQLDKLVLCRFGCLSPDIQRILRTASIIGMTFTCSVLSAVIHRRLRDELEQSIQTLLNQRWLYLHNTGHDLELNYQFSHQHVHRTLYELTPSSERSQTHGLIADHIEALYRDDKSQYGLLSFHYQHCNPDKALMYSAKATEVLLQVTSIYDFNDCVDLLSGCVSCCITLHDVSVMFQLISKARIAILAFPIDATVPMEASTSFIRCISACILSCSYLGRSTSGKVVPNLGATDNDQFDVAPNHSAVGEMERYVPVDRPMEQEAAAERQNAMEAAGSVDRDDSWEYSPPPSKPPLVLVHSHSLYSSQSSTGAADDAYDDDDAEINSNSSVVVVRAMKRAQNRLLHRLSRLFEKLSEKYVDLSEQIEVVRVQYGVSAGATKPMKPWQEEFLKPLVES